MTLQEWQKKCGEWQRETFGEGGIEKAPGLLAHMEKELHELTLEFYSPEFNADKAGEEMADVFLLLIALADRCSIDLGGAVAKKMLINYDRTWGKPDERGVVQHLRESPAQYLGSDPT